jgi:murein DD-endopeptidase MepM/ murein hydrolase activator NlpD
MRSFVKCCAVALLSFGALAGCKTTGSGKAPVYLIRIEKGDTLASIAQKYDTSWEKIASLNNLGKGEAPKVGSVIRVEPGQGGLVAQNGGGLFARGLARKLPKQTKAQASNNANANNQSNENEFEEEDLMAGDAKGQAGGLLFGTSVSSGSGLEWPLFGDISSYFGKRGRRMHKGIDIRAKRGTAIMAAGPGVVEFAGRQHGYGKVVIIRHKNNMKTLYGHMNVIDVKKGDVVTHGTELGAVGTTGNASGPHLHFEIHNDKDQPLDPLAVIPKKKLLSSNH